MLTSNIKLPTYVQKHRPYKHQADAFTKTKELEFYGLLWEMGLGKTKTIIDTAVWLFYKIEIDGLLIIAPKGAYMNWITNELPAHLPDIPTRVAYWNVDAPKKEMNRALNLRSAKDDTLDICCMNIEALSTDRGYIFAHQFLSAHYGMMVIDESSFIKNPKAKRTKAAIQLGRLANYRRILSGTPMVQSPLDIFTQMEFLKPGVLGYKNFFMFRQHFAVIIRIVHGNRSFDKIDKYINLEELSNLIEPYTDRKTKVECLDLPEKILIRYYVTQTQEQARLYKEFRDNALLEFSKEEIVSSTSVLTTIIKLHQINCGHVKLDSGVIQHVPHNRINSLIEIIESADNKKIIIWAHFQEDVRSIIARLREEYGNNSAVDLYGLTTDPEESLDKFRVSEECRFLVATAACAGRSYTFTNTSLNIYYSYSYNLEHWLQSQDRTHRIGQKSAVTYIVMVTDRSIDVEIQKALEKKKHLADEVLDNWRQLLST